MARGMGLTGTVTVGADCRTRTCDPLITNRVVAYIPRYRFLTLYGHNRAFLLSSIVRIALSS